MFQRTSCWANGKLLSDDEALIFFRSFSLNALRLDSVASSWRV
jgi:hypothetical protein